MVVFLWRLDPGFVNDPANLFFRRKQRFLGVGKPVLNKSQRSCRGRSRFQLIDIRCEAFGGGFCKPQSMIGLVQGKVEVFTFHRFTLGVVFKGVRGIFRGLILPALRTSRDGGSYSFRSETPGDLNR